MIDSSLDVFRRNNGRSRGDALLRYAIDDLH
jgi:hypothetical protein